MFRRRHSDVVRCPRCGYDQRGEMSTWSECCPLESTCTECGLGFDWRDILNPTLFRAPSWCVEGARGALGAVGAMPKTLLRTFWPWSFWGSLRLTHVIRWRRIAAYLIAVTLALYVVALLCHVAALRTTWRNSGAIYGWKEIGTAFALPLSDVAPNQTLVPGAPPGMTIMRARSSSRQMLLWMWSERLPSIAFFILLHVMCALGFVALPVSRRRAKVRWAHVWRILAYGLVLSVPALVVVAAGDAPAGQLGRSTSSLVLQSFMGAAWLTSISIVPLEIIWWSTATGRYLRMEHAWAVGTAVVVMATLVAWAVLWALRG